MLHQHDRNVALMLLARVDHRNHNDLMGLMNTVHFSPIRRRMDFQELAHWILADRLRVLLNLQLHKVIWDPHQRGQ